VYDTNLASKYTGSLTYASLPSDTQGAWTLNSQGIYVNDQTSSTLSKGLNNVIFDSGTSNVIMDTGTTEVSPGGPETAIRIHSTKKILIINFYMVWPNRLSTLSSRPISSPTRLNQAHMAYPVAMSPA
jgi:hypothetical protein